MTFTDEQRKAIETLLLNYDCNKRHLLAIGLTAVIEEILNGPGEAEAVEVSRSPLPSASPEPAPLDGELPEHIAEKAIASVTGALGAVIETMQVAHREACAELARVANMPARSVDTTPLTDAERKELDWFRAIQRRLAGAPDIEPGEDLLTYTKRIREHLQKTDAARHSNPRGPRAG